MEYRQTPTSDGWLIEAWEDGKRLAGVEYCADENPDEHDYSAKTWELVRDDILRNAEEMKQRANLVYNLYARLHRAAAAAIRSGQPIDLGMGLEGK